MQNAIDSVLNQSYPAAEVIVVDDGSDDGSVKFLTNKYLNAIKLVSIKHGGVSRARNTGAISAAAPWIAFLDSDDVWHHNKLQIQVNYMESNPGYNLCHSNEIWYRNTRRVNQMHKHRKAEGDYFIRGLERCLISPSTVLLNKQKFFDIGGFDVSMPACEDYDLWLRWGINNKVLLCEEKLVTRYGGHSDQLSQKYQAMDRFRVKSLLKIINNYKLPEKYSLKLQEVLAKKLTILQNGAAKRGLLDELNNYQKILQQYCLSGE